MQLNHYLNFQGETEAAFNFYKSVFGGDFSFIKRYSELPDAHVTGKEKDYILHEPAIHRHMLHADSFLFLCL